MPSMVTRVMASLQWKRWAFYKGLFRSDYERCRICWELVYLPRWDFFKSLLGSDSWNIREYCNNNNNIWKSPIHKAVKCYKIGYRLYCNEYWWFTIKVTDGGSFTLSDPL
jgi:hypothetical protein